ncbi:oxidoreductase [trundated] [Staphylococcus haemolyticus JCSC1435]|uniref:Oxidoreductase [trundated] n=1 Tax=Staphylococcus haemolyticus (strain JCSC1435) TaxID=279808 RepID=Q4L4I1_STAHJ|nr:oxidoreductase [trundated] [Staphylococcus haemolyticus JCSC1435]
MGKVILITGATSGIGYKTAEYLAVQGIIVYGASRRIESLENIKQVNPLKLDLTNEASIKTAIDTIIENEGRIDVLVNNAGYGSYGAIEDITIE